MGRHCETSSRLVLRNTRVGTLQDRWDAWPAKIDLEGFEYRHLGGLGGNETVDVAARGSRWFVDWLAKSAGDRYSPQPYVQLAAVLRQMGHPEEASDVLYAEREQARRRAWKDGHYANWAGQTLLKFTIGYGYGTGYFRTLWWVGGLVALGIFILRWTEQTTWPGGDGKRPIKLGAVYALDMLLPIIRLREAHYEVDLEGRARYYFYGNKIMGYVLGFFLVAGLSGITK
jgi:hypothetical protein